MTPLARCSVVVGTGLALLVVAAPPGLAHTGESHGGNGWLQWLGTAGIGVAALATAAWTTWRERRRSR